MVALDISCDSPLMFDIAMFCDTYSMTSYGSSAWSDFLGHDFAQHY